MKIELVPEREGKQMKYVLNGGMLYVATLVVVAAGAMCWLSKISGEAFMLVLIGVVNYYFGTATGIIRKNKQEREA